MNALTNSIAIIIGAALYCVMTAISFLLYLVPLAIGLWILQAVFG